MGDLTSKGAEESESSASEGWHDPRGTVLVGLGALVLGTGLMVWTFTTGARLGSVDASDPQLATVLRVFQSRSFWEPEVWLLVEPTDSDAGPIRVDLLVDQFSAYQRGDLIRVFPLRGRGTFITDRELAVAEPLWRVGSYAFSWQLFAALAVLGLAPLILARGILGIRQESAQLGFGRWAFCETMDILFTFCLAVLFGMSISLGYSEAMFAGRTYRDIDAAAVVPMRVAAVAETAHPLNRHTFYVLGFLPGEAMEQRVPANKELFLELRAGDEVPVVRCRDDVLSLAEHVKNSQPIITIGGVSFSWHLFIVAGQVVLVFVLSSLGIQKLKALWSECRTRVRVGSLS